MLINIKLHANYYRTGCIEFCSTVSHRTTLRCPVTWKTGGISYMDNNNLYKTRRTTVSLFLYLLLDLFASRPHDLDY